jgi:RNA polymerase sigma-70 factor (ECF subfamily)
LAVQQEISDDYLLDLLSDERSVEKGFRLLMHKYQERLYWQIYKILPEHEDVNDVLQNCFIKVYRNVQSFEGKSQLYTWLYRIATNEAITFLNKKKRHRASAIDDQDNHLANVLEADQYFDAQAAEVKLHRATERLPEKQKEVFLLRYFEEKSYQEISDLLDTSVGALKASYHHAVKKIEGFLKEND